MLKKIYKILLLILALIIFFCIACFVFYLFDEKDYCLDTNICKEGYKINTEFGLIKVNKLNCEKYGYIWNDKTKECNFNKKH